MYEDKDEVVDESYENSSQPMGITQNELAKVLGKEFERDLSTVEKIKVELPK